VDLQEEVDFKTEIAPIPLVAEEGVPEFSGLMLSIRLVA
jgi:hypothetical protein